MRLFLKVIFCSKLLFLLFSCNKEKISIETNPINIKLNHENLDSILIERYNFYYKTIGIEYLSNGKQIYQGILNIGDLNLIDKTGNFIPLEAFTNTPINLGDRIRYLGSTSDFEIYEDDIYSIFEDGYIYIKKNGEILSELTLPKGSPNSSKIIIPVKQGLFYLDVFTETSSSLRIFFCKEGKCKSFEDIFEKELSNFENDYLTADIFDNQIWFTSFNMNYLYSLDLNSQKLDSISTPRSSLIKESLNINEELEKIYITSLDVTDKNYFLGYKLILKNDSVASYISRLKINGESEFSQPQPFVNFDRRGNFFYHNTSEDSLIIKPISLVFKE